MAFVSIGTPAINSLLLKNTSTSGTITSMKFYNQVKMSPNFSSIENYTVYNSSILSTYTPVLERTFSVINMKFDNQVPMFPNFSSIENYTVYNASILSTYTAVLDSTFTTMATPKFSGTGLYYYTTESYTLPTSYIFWS